MTWKVEGYAHTSPDHELRSPFEAVFATEGEARAFWEASKANTLCYISDLIGPDGYTVAKWQRPSDAPIPGDVGEPGSLFETLSN
jgi:hypothetical protein